MKARIAIALMLAGCPAGLEEQQHISKLRVLAVRADPPELIVAADAGIPSTTLTALAVDPSGAAISMRYALCTDLGGVPSPALPCPGNAGIDLPEAGPLSARLDLSDPRILAFAASVRLDGGAFDANGIPATLDQGVPLLIGFAATTSAEDLEGFAIFTLRTPARGPANVNPELADLIIGDGGVHPGNTVRLQPVAPKNDATKRYGFSFFATAGSISTLRSTDTTATGQPAPTWVDWTAPDNSQEVHLWVVLRDGRGGTAWLEKSLLVR